jgi:hypothetical protein
MRLPKLVLIGLVLMILTIGGYLSALVTSPVIQHHSTVQSGKDAPNTETYLFISPVIHFHVIAHGSKGPPNGET